MASAATSIECPYKLLAEYAKDLFDTKSPLKQFASKILGTSGTSDDMKKWKCNICSVEWFDSITRVNAHFLFIQGKGVEPCPFLEDPANIKYRIGSTSFEVFLMIVQLQCLPLCLVGDNFNRAVFP